MTEEKVVLATYGQYIRQKIADRESFIVHLQLAIPFDDSTLPLQLLVEGAEGTYVVHPFTGQCNERANLQILETIIDNEVCHAALESCLLALELPHVLEIFANALLQGEQQAPHPTHHQAGRA